MQTESTLKDEKYEKAWSMLKESRLKNRKLTSEKEKMERDLEDKSENLTILINKNTELQKLSETIPGLEKRIEDLLRWRD